MKKELISITLLVFVVVSHAAAQQGDPTIPPPPSAQVSTPITPPQSFEPFTQADLEIVTGNVQRPNGIVWYNNFLYTACTGDQTLYEINSTSGATLTYIAGVVNAHTLHADVMNGNALSLWVPDFGTNELLNITRTRIERIDAALQGPWGIAALDESRFLITNLLSSTLALVSRDGESEIVLDGLASPTGIVIDDDTIYIANNGSTRRAIEYFPISIVDGIEAEPEVLVRGLQNTTGLVMGSDGLIYFAYSLGTRGLVGRVDPDYCRQNGGCTAEDIDIVIYSDLEAPLAGLTISDDMRLYVHTMFRPEIYWVQIPN